jgi:hypothetical protein
MVTETDCDVVAIDRIPVTKLQVQNQLRLLKWKILHERIIGQTNMLLLQFPLFVEHE